MPETSRIVTSALASLHLHLADLYGRLLLVETESKRWRLQQEISETQTAVQKLKDILP
jgi:hypothetical protein